MELYSFVWTKGIHCLHGRTAGYKNFCVERPPQPAFGDNWRVLFQNLPSNYNLCYFNTKKKKISDTQHFFFACSEKIARESKIHSYKKSLNGFVARLLPHEAQRISGLHKYKIDTQISALKRLMTLLITSDVMMLALTCRWKESRISFSKHIAPSSHNKNMGFLRNARNIETKKRQYGEQYHCWHLGYRLVKIFFFFYFLSSHGTKSSPFHS